MIKVIKKIEDYTFSEFSDYCKNNDLSPDEYKLFFREWAISSQEYELVQFVNTVGKHKQVTVNGYVNINGVSHKVKAKTLSLEQAMNAILTTDTQDYCVLLSSDNTYHVITVHAQGRNVFKFKLND